MSTLGSEGVDEAIEAFLGRKDAHETVTSHLEMRWLEAAGEAIESRCPVRSRDSQRKPSDSR